MLSCSCGFTFIPHPAGLHAHVYAYLLDYLSFLFFCEAFLDSILIMAACVLRKCRWIAGQKCKQVVVEGTSGCEFNTEH